MKSRKDELNLFTKEKTTISETTSGRNSLHCLWINFEAVRLFGSLLDNRNPQYLSTPALLSSTRDPFTNVKGPTAAVNNSLKSEAEAGTFREGIL